MRIAAAFLSLGLAFATPTAPGAPAEPIASPWFDDATDAAGIEFVHVRNVDIRLWLPEIMSGGAAWFDADGDGWLDLYLVQGGYLDRDPIGVVGAASDVATSPDDVAVRDSAPIASTPATAAPPMTATTPATAAPPTGAAAPVDTATRPAVAIGSASGGGDGSSPRPANVLLRNVRGQRFEDVTARSGTGDTGYGMGVAAGDYDGDGDIDLYVTNLGPNVLYENDGTGSFTDVTDRAGVGDPAWGTSAAWLDYDNDGDLDLFVANYINWAAARELQCFTGGALRDYCHPRHYNAPAPDVLYRNDDGRFVDVTRSAGLSAAFGHGLGVAVADFDLDGHMDIYVANDGMPNQLWHNRGDGSFEDIGLISGTAVNMAGKAEAGMGVAAMDADEDGDLDLFMSHLRGETNTLYLNEGRFFRDATPTAGLAAASVPYTGFGLGFADFDHDGTLDLYIANGRVGRSLPALVEGKPFAEPNLLFRGSGRGRYALVTPLGGTPTPDVENSRAAAFADYDRDGDVDIVVVNNGGPARLLRNRRAQGHWIALRVLDGVVDAHGAMVAVTDGAGQQRWRPMQPAYSYQSSNDPHVHLGFGAEDAIEDVLVRWPDGSLEHFGALALDRFHTLRRGRGTAVLELSPGTLAED